MKIEIGQGDGALEFERAGLSENDARNVGRNDLAAAIERGKKAQDLSCASSAIGVFLARRRRPADQRANSILEMPLSCNSAAIASRGVTCELRPRIKGAKMTHARRWMLAVSIVGLAISLTARAEPGAPSFDCAKASAADERAICEDSRLSEMDQAMTIAFGQVKKESKGEAKGMPRRRWPTGAPAVRTGCAFSISRRMRYRPSRTWGRACPFRLGWAPIGCSSRRRIRGGRPGFAQGHRPLHLHENRLHLHAFWR